MKTTKRIITILLSIVMIFSTSIVDNGYVNVIGADATFTITSPTDRSLKAAGYINIEWTAASNGEVENYKVYVDGKLSTTTKALSCEYYTTNVCYHEAYVTAEYTNGKTETTSKVLFGVTKKGLCVATDMGRNLDPATVGAGWYYNWGKAPFTYPKYKNLEFVPMIWGYQTASSIANDCKRFESQGYKYVLAFNEPETWMNQSKIEVSKALDAWPGFMKTNLRVSSPATALNPIWENKAGQWWYDFMQGINADASLDFDFVAVHIYYENYASKKAGEDMLKLVDQIYALCKKPLWITEYAPSKNVSKSGTADFVKVTTEGFTQRSYVERFSYFNFNPNKGESKNAAAWYYETGKLTDAGKNYANYGNPTKDYKGNVIVPGQTPNEPQKPTAKPTAKPTVNYIVKKPVRVKIKSAKNQKGRKIKLSLKKITGVKGYQIRWSDSKKFNGYWQKSVKKTTYVIKKLDKKTKYYIKARAYVMKDNNKLYGQWSKVKKIKVKK